MPRFGHTSRKPSSDQDHAHHSPDRSEDASTLTPKMEGEAMPERQLHRATRTRKVFALLTSFFLLLAVIFLVLVEIGSTFDKPVLRDTYFIKLDLSHIVPTSVPNAVLLNSIAQTLGLHDFYQVGLWNFCEGYKSQGVTYCSHPETMYWFNPIEILLNELLAGATIAIPEEVLTYLHIVRVVSHWMFGLFLTGACLAALMIILTPLSLYSRWVALPVALFTFLAALFTTIASVLATAMFVIFSNAITKVGELNIGAHVGRQMFAFMWIASFCTIVAWLVQMGLCCCCASRRDVKKGKKKGSKKAYSGDYDVEKSGTGSRSGRFGRTKA
ncbi:hypothetical protein K490DRAFT_45035 [Saccharata proteae CBS 121410]|uniref:Integral membrane protein n=1 Tax=Saccharata proteae CBS 121410 TaxID=1314787 RepID=A0A9P4HV01_9PEZI|nr:hypothetical protein K490DRAFT_45035 [Saccharata proteae CBS 121410]